jgi:hypothetical protein
MHARDPRLAAVALTVMILAGCQGPLMPGDALTGRYSNEGAVLQATSHGVTLREACLSATFPAFVLDANLNFSSQSTTLDITGNIQHSPDDRMFLTGHLAGNDLMLNVVVSHPGGPAVDPIPMTLKHNGPDPSLVCSA